MDTREHSEQTSFDDSHVSQLDPDVLVLGEYLANKRGLSFVEFLEYLITEEASKGKGSPFKPA